MNLIFKVLRLVELIREKIITIQNNRYKNRRKAGAWERELIPPGHGKRGLLRETRIS